MNPISELTNLSRHTDFAVTSCANKAIKYHREFEEGLISKEEHEELLRDLISQKNLAKFADELETQAKIEEAVKALIAIAQAAS
jgi:hypothetical protein